MNSDDVTADFGPPPGVQPPPEQLELPQRQSLWAVAFLALRTLRQIGLVQMALAVGFVLARLPSVWTFIGLVLVVGVALFVVAALQWWRYTFMVLNDELVVQRGVLQQQTLSIPLDRVQSISLEQKLLHRPISLVQVTVETAGTQAAEFVIDAVEQPVAQLLQRAVANYRGSAESDGGNAAAGDGPPDTAAIAPPPPEQTLVSHSPRRVVKIALTQTPFAGLVLVAPLFAVANDLGSYIPFDLPEIEDPTAGWWLLWLVPLVLLAGFAMSVVLNLVRVLLTDWGLTLTETAAGLRRNAGLLSTTSVAATVPRVQIVRISQTVLERLASLRTVTLATVGAAKLSVPGCDEDQAAAVRALVLADSAGVQNLDQQVSPQQVFLVTRNTAVAMVLVAVATSFFAGWWSALFLLVVPWTWAKTRRMVRLRRWGMTADALADRREFVGWHRQELLVRKINGVSVRQSLFERKRDLATLTVATAAGSLAIGMLSVDQAYEVRDRVLHQIETDRRAWM